MSILTGLKSNTMATKICCAKPTGEVIKTNAYTPSAYQRTQAILRELGQDAKDYYKDVKLRSLFRQAELNLITI